MKEDKITKLEKRVTKLEKEIEEIWKMVLRNRRSCSVNDIIGGPTR